MDFVSVLNKSEPHQRTIIHLDMDCFYAQVEEIRDPTLRTIAMGVKQKNCVVTCNYVARAQGVSKMMTITEALTICPNLRLVAGEDLTPYRQMSQKIYDVLINYTPAVEKLGFDENFMDVSALVESRINQIDDDARMSTVIGHIYPADGTTLNACDCGCANRLAIGTQLAQEIREELHLKLGITCCGGIAYNKLLSKLVGSRNKPNQQTVLVSTHAEQFMRELHELHRITGIGRKTETLLLESGVDNVEQLQQCDMDFLRKKFGFETATKLKDLAFGRDTSTVRPSGKPKSIGMEDSGRPISVRSEVEERFRMLLMRLVEQVAEDGRIPIAIKVMLRKYDAQKKSSHRETKQVNILPSLFKSSPCTDTGGAKVQLADGALEKLLIIIMRLFERIVDLSKPFYITLIGLAFSKFQQRKVGSSSIANFLIKKSDLEVQSITSLTNTSVCEPTSPCEASALASLCPQNNDEVSFRLSPTTFKPSDQFYRRRATTASPIPMLIDNGSESAATNSDFSDFSETEVEPSPKKSRIGRVLTAKRSRLVDDTPMDIVADVASPSKLRVCDLRLNSRDSEKDFPMGANSPTTSTSSTATAAAPTTTIQRLRTVPNTLACRLDGIGRRRYAAHTFSANRLSQSSACSSSPTSPLLPSPMDAKSSSTPTTPTQPSICNMNEPRSTSTAELPTIAVDTNSISLSNIPCPAGVDPQVFNELPKDVQNELIVSWRSSLAAAAAAVANGSNGAVTTTTTSSSSSSSAFKVESTTDDNTIDADSSSSSTTTKSDSNNAQKNTLYRYFLRNK